MKTTSCTVAALTMVLTFAPVNGNLIPTSISSLLARGSRGINKEGSSQCFFQGKVGTLATIKTAINKIAVNTTYFAGDKIACGGYATAGVGFPDHNAPFNDVPNVDGFCASLCKNTPSAKVRTSTMGNNNDFADVVDDLVNIGATQCGTAPLIRTADDKNLDGSEGPRVTYPGPNLLSTGCISINYVTAVCEAIIDDPCQLTRPENAPSG
ncbi:MAG: hypothetical protein Q9174_006010 [Haloplaca sp. 1 TL-2023]